MRAVLIAPIMPSDSRIGLAMRAGMWLETLSQRFDTDLVLAQEFSPPDGGEQFSAAHAATITNLRGRLGFDPDLPRTVPVIDAESAERLRDVLVGADLVVVFRLYLLELAESAHRVGIPIIVDLDDFDWVREERLGNEAEAQRYLRFAQAHLHEATVATTASATDSDGGALIHDHPTWLHVRNGVRPPLEIPPHPQDIDLLFVSTLGYEPNAEAAVWFATEVLPHLPGVRAAIVGSSPPAAVRSLAGPDLVIAPDVREVSSWYARSRACVVPIHKGSGTRTKIPEAWAHHRPVVSTTLGAEGLEVEGAALIADSAQDFADACQNLLRNKERRQALVQEGWDRYVAGHSLDLAMTSANEAIDEAFTRTGRIPPEARVQP